ncbi:unnamed protein product [Cunninghamella blakesleeana]
MLREVLEKNQQLKNIVHSQAEQIRYSHPLPSDTEKVIDTMKQVYTMSENEQKLNYNTETRMLHKDIQALSRRLLNLKQILQSIEDMELLPEDQKLNKEELLEDRKNLLRKLHLAHLRLKAREAELDYFQDILKQSSFKYDTLHTNHTTSTSPNHNSSSSKPSSSTSPKATHHKSPRFTDSPRNRPYLFQQQYSPKMRSNIRPATAISGLDSLGILADQMLSDPNFESSQQVSPSSPSSNMTSTSAFKKVSQQQKQFQQNDNNNNNSNTEKLKRQQQLQQHIYQQQQALKRSLPKRHLYSIYARGTGGRYYEESDDDNNSNTNDDMDDDQARYNEKRSKRSIDSANTLLSMFPTKPKNSNEDVVMKEDKGTNERPKSKLAYVRWTPEEDQLLRRAVEMNGTSNWDKVANMVTDRSSQQCRQRWSKYLDQKSTTTTISSPVSSPIIMTSSSPSSSKLPPSSFHSPSSKDARHSPSIAALLNTTTIEEEKSHRDPSYSLINFSINQRSFHDGANRS